MKTIDRKISVAPMLEWTDRHYRYMARLLSRHVLLFTEMVPLGALIHGDARRFLVHEPEENPLVLQIGGSEPEHMAEASRLAKSWGYDEININCGCPSPKVQKGSFGACLMREVDLVKSMILEAYEGSDIPCTVKHRIGLDKIEDYSFVRDFVGTLAESTPNKVFYVHARNAWLKGLSPKENREVPPLRYEMAYRLKEEFPDLEIIVNGGVKTHEEIQGHLAKVDGVMVGRLAYHDPIFLRDLDRLYYGDDTPSISNEELVTRMWDYCAMLIGREEGTRPRHVYRHVLNLFPGVPGSKIWRRMLSDHTLLNKDDPDLILEAFSHLRFPEENEGSYD